jgi:hypothetical protein
MEKKNYLNTLLPLALAGTLLVGCKDQFPSAEAGSVKNLDRTIISTESQAKKCLENGKGAIVDSFSNDVRGARKKVTTCRIFDGDGTASFLPNESGEKSISFKVNQEPVSKDNCVNNQWFTPQGSKNDRIWYNDDKELQPIKKSVGAWQGFTGLKKGSMIRLDAEFDPKIDKNGMKFGQGREEKTNNCFGSYKDLEKLRSDAKSFSLSF